MYTVKRTTLEISLAECLTEEPGDSHSVFSNGLANDRPVLLNCLEYG